MFRSYMFCGQKRVHLSDPVCPFQSQGLIHVHVVYLLVEHSEAALCHAVFVFRITNKLTD
jgi:hypothetical protein